MRFHLFGWDEYSENCGGLNSYLGSFDSFEEAASAAWRSDMDWPIWEFSQVVVERDGKLVQHALYVAHPSTTAPNKNRWLFVDADPALTD